MDVGAIRTSGVMSTPPSPLPALKHYLQPFLTPYYFFIAGMLGAITALFVVVIVLLVLTATNFNVLGWIE